MELPQSLGNTVIWVVTDLFSKQVHFASPSNLYFSFLCFVLVLGLKTELRGKSSFSYAACKGVGGGDKLH